MSRSRQTDDAALGAILARQYQVISRSQALASGMTESTLDYRLRAGGPWYHLSPEDHERTLARDARMRAYGINVLHFTPRQIRTQPGQVIAAIKAALAAPSSSSPCPIRTVSVAAASRPARRYDPPATR